MESLLLDAPRLRWSSAYSLSSCTCLTKPPIDPPRTPRTTSLVVKAAKRIPEVPSTGLQKNTRKDLSRILRTEAAVENIERKANSKKYENLWPKAVLEALDEAIRENRWESALKIFKLLRKQHWYEPRCRTYTKLFVMLGKCRQPKPASLLFEIMLSDGLKPTVDVYTALVSVYGLSGCLDEAFSTIDDMKSASDCKPDVFTYSILIKCCIKLDRFDMIESILAEMAFLGVQCSTVTYNTIIDGYGKAKMFELMESSLTDMIESATCLPDTCTLNSFVWAYGSSRTVEKMEKWYNEFQLMGVMPDVQTFNILIRSYGKASMYEKMCSVMKFMKRRFFSPTIITYNIVIEAFGKAGNIEKMEEFFRQMKYQGMKPNSITYCSLVSAYSKVHDIRKVDSILRQVANSDVTLDTPFFNAIISAYGQAGDLERVNEAFLAMKDKKCEPDDITFASMIRAYNAQGMIEAAQDLEIELKTYKNNSGKRLTESQYD